MDIIGYQTYNPSFSYYDFTQKKTISETLNIQYITDINAGGRYCSHLIDLINSDNNPFAGDWKDNFDKKTWQLK